MGALSRFRQYLRNWNKRKVRSWESMEQYIPAELLGFLAGKTVGTATQTGYADPPANTIPLYTPDSPGETDGEIYIASNLSPSKAWIWANGAWVGLSGGSGGGSSTVTAQYPKYDEDADDAGLYREIVGQPFPTSVIWYTDATKVTKVKELLITRDVGQNPTVIVWKFYTAGTLTKTYTDTITYSPGSILEVSRTRSIM